MNYSFEHREAAEALYDALVEDAFYAAMEQSVAGDRSDRREAMLRYYDFSMQEAGRYGALHVPIHHPMGAAVWSKPLNGEQKAPVAAQKRAFLTSFMGPASLDTYQRITRFMAAHTEKHVSPHSWYLSILGLAPPFQGQGRGGRLLRPVLDHTDKLGRPTYLETFTPRNMGFYRKQGYREVADFVEPLTQARYWVMVREPLAVPTEDSV